MFRSIITPVSLFISLFFILKTQNFVPILSEIFTILECSGLFIKLLMSSSSNSCSIKIDEPSSSLVWLGLSCARSCSRTSTSQKNNVNTHIKFYSWPTMLQQHLSCTLTYIICGPHILLHTKCVWGLQIMRIDMYLMELEVL